MNSRFAFLLSVSFFFTGCDGCESPPPTPHQAALEQIRNEKRTAPVSSRVVKRETETINKNRELVVAVPYLPEHLNPFLHISEWGYRISMHNIYEGLLDRDPKTGKLVGALAESWYAEPGGKVFRFTLRPGLRWQDGRPLTVEDVRFTFSLLTIPRIKKGPFLTDINYSFKRFDSTGSRQFRIVLNEANAFFLDHLVELPVVPSHVFFRGISKKSRGSTSPVGSGPYRLYQWIPQEKIILVKNEYYWGSVPEVERIVFVNSPDVAKSFVGIRRNQLGMLPEVSPVHYPAQITENIKKDYNLYSFIPPVFSYILWNTSDPMLADFRVRRALSMLINTDEIIKKVYRGLAKPCLGPFWRPGGLGRTNSHRWEYNPHKAKKLLEQVGWKDTDGDKILDKQGRPMKLIVLLPVDARKGKSILEVIKGDYQRAGIEMMIVPTDWKLFKTHLKKKKFAAAFLTWRGRPYEDFSPLFHSAGRYNYGVVYNILIDRHLAQMRLTSSFSMMKPLSIKLEEMLESYLPVTFLTRPVEISIIHKRFSNVIPTSEGYRYAKWKVSDKPVSKNLQ
ncbi:MAG: hypothetical protein JXR95_11265 [Deltaproteobacteria bacterium]|nr:hypothetical protein [Deltaproteobacteria bacterium]